MILATAGLCLNFCFRTCSKFSVDSVIPSEFRSSSANNFSRFIFFLITERRNSTRFDEIDAPERGYQSGLIPFFSFFMLFQILGNEEQSIDSISFSRFTLRAGSASSEILNACSSNSQNCLSNFSRFSSSKLLQNH